MEQQEVNSLLDKYKEGTASPAEIDALHHWYRETGYADGVYPDEEALVKTRIQHRLIASIEPVKEQKLWPRIIGVAAAVTAITLGVWLYYASNLNGRHPDAGQDPGSAQYANDIAPGKNTATIKIGDGEAITLSDKQIGVIVAAGSLKYDDNTPVISNEERNLLNSTNKRSLPYGRDDGRMLTITTPRGGTYQVTLPDGTKVWLNAASVLTYTMPLKERGGIRKVQLSGEAYFEVFRNKNQPFVVSTKNLTTTVLGTHFNINAYEDEGSTKATLLEGSVRVANTPRHPELVSGPPPGKTAMRDVTLTPNQQASVTGSTGIKVKEVDVNETVAWKNGRFRFNNASLEEVMKQLARWYDVEVVYPNGIPDTRFSGGINRNLTAAKALSLMQFMNVKFKIEGKKIIVTK